MAIQHTWHDHPLLVSSVLSDAEARCFICLQPLSGYGYRCPKCNLFLHISCLKLPLESLHPLHQHHPLTLLSADPDAQLVCSDCGSPCSGFTYNCAACAFALHLPCASKERVSRPEIHKHPLTFSISPPSGYESFRCKVCGDLGKGFSLYCKVCVEFVVHVECSTLPVTVKRERDQHPFILTPARSVDDESEEDYCEICEEAVNPEGCVYYCAERSYIAHLGCLISAPKPHIKLAYRDVDVSSAEDWGRPKLATDPSGSGSNHPLEITSDPIDDYHLTKLRRRYSKHLIGDKIESSQKEEEQLAEPIDHNTKHDVVEIQHFSHQHPLTLADDHEKVLCYACWGRFSGLGYGCSQTECNFFLHRWCAELPQNIQHPIHPEHSLTLLPRVFSLVCSGCNACDELCDEFTYNCKFCSFNLHAMCASIPSTLINDIHQHALTLRRKIPYSARCKACGNDCTGTVFQCDICNLVLDFKCALLPRKIRHQCHVDPLTFTSLVEDDSDEFYCDACEEPRDPNHWVYHCAGCDFSAHMNCVVSELIGGPPSLGLLQFDHHTHLLSLITESPISP